MYVGVHTPADVLVGAAISLALIFALRPLMSHQRKGNIPVVFGIMLMCSAAFLLFVEFYPFPADLDPHNYESALKNSYTLLGCSAGVLVCYFADEKKFHFDTRAVWWAQILKVFLGLLAVLLVKEGAKIPLGIIFGSHMASRAVRYFLVVVMAGIIWPMTFQYFAKLGKK
jgi:hypothetical protein